MSGGLLTEQQTSGTLVPAPAEAAAPAIADDGIVVIPTPARARVGRLRRLLDVRPARLVAILAILNLADLVTTRLVLDRGGAEGNPVMRPFVNEVWDAALLKGSCVVLIAALVSRCSTSLRVRVGLALVVAWYAVVVTWNLAALARAA
jgi:hypothetical protein